MDEELLEELRTRKIDGICVELQVWQRLVTALDDSCLLESALGQADTTARLQTVWRVVASPVSMLVKRSSAEELTLVKRSSALEVEKPGKLCATLGNTGDDCSCQPIPPAGYQGLENQLYRVEIHQGGDETTATFKWSRENASIVAAITGSSTVNGQTVLFVDSLGRDANLGFAANQWVEIADDSNEFGDTPNQPGQLWQIASVSAAGQPPSITFNTIISPSTWSTIPACAAGTSPGPALQAICRSHPLSMRRSISRTESGLPSLPAATGAATIGSFPRAPHPAPSIGRPVGAVEGASSPPTTFTSTPRHWP